MKNHEAMHNKQRPYQCSKCDKSYRKRYQLKDHERSHTGEKPFQCEICKICFISSANVRKHHKNIHNNDASMCILRLRPTQIKRFPNMVRGALCLYMHEQKHVNNTMHE